MMEVMKLTFLGTRGNINQRTLGAKAEIAYDGMEIVLR